MGENLFKAETPDTVVEKMNFEREQAAKASEPVVPVVQTTPVAQVTSVASSAQALPTTSVTEEKAAAVVETPEAPAFNDVFKNTAAPMQNVSTENFYKEEKADVVVETEIAKKEDNLKLFVTKTCPNCKKAEELLDMAGIKYSIVDANENPSDCEKYQIMQAPTLVVNDSTKYVNLSNVIKFVEETTMTV
ncbi:MAG: thioredoxin family protein [Lachnospiraceae bacterium]|nr:thioredoxin family protein [Lachnospiraceae bacterium]